ncbi:MAG: ArsR family transcriptional regulator, partial [Promethearchaeota archaeon]
MTSQSKLSPIVTGTRRLILESLLRTDANAVTLAENLGINISAIRGHLDVLELAGLITSTY